MYAAFEHVMMYVWAVYACILLGFLVWAAWVFAIDEPRKKRRIRKRLAQVVPPKRP